PLDLSDDARKPECQVPISPERARQVAIRAAERDPVAAARIVKRHGELRAIGLQVCLITAVIECAPHVLETGIHRARDRRVHQLWPVKLDRFAALNQWSAEDDPLRSLTVLDLC